MKATNLKTDVGTPPIAQSSLTTASVRPISRNTGSVVAKTRIHPSSTLASPVSREEALRQAIFKTG